MKKHYTYEEIERFTIEECKIAKLELQMNLPDIKAKLEDWRDGIEPDIDGERLERTYRHLRRLLHKVELRMMLIKQMDASVVDKSVIRAENERNRQANELISSAIKPKPYHAVFCHIAHDYLDQETLNGITAIVRQKMEEIKASFDY